MIRKLKNKHNHQGFTMIEVIAVLIIVGILAVVAAVKMSNTSDFDLASQLEVVKGHLRLAQAKALGSGSNWGINFTNSTTYYMHQATAPSTPVLMIGENNATVDLSTKKSALRITSATSAPQQIEFDAFGSAGATTLTVATNGGNITITKNTGFIP